MSIESWKEEFMPVDASELREKSDLECLKHAHKKWTGLTKSNMQRHGIFQADDYIHNNADDNKTYITDETCSLCRKYYNDFELETECWLCPLKDCSNQYRSWFNTSNPNPMIKLIEEKIKLIEEQNENTANS